MTDLVKFDFCDDCDMPGACAAGNVRCRHDDRWLDERPEPEAPVLLEITPAEASEVLRALKRLGMAAVKNLNKMRQAGARPRYLAQAQRQLDSLRAASAAVADALGAPDGRRFL